MQACSMNNPETPVSFQELYGVISETLARDGTVSFTANGSSMHPFIRGGTDKVVLHSLPERIRKHDIVFYRRKNGQFVLHRVVACKGSAFVMCGDNQFILERNVTRDLMIGIVSSLERDGRSIDPFSFSGKVYCFFLPCRRFFLRLKRYFSLILHKLFKT